MHGRLSLLGHVQELVCTRSVSTTQLGSVGLPIRVRFGSSGIAAAGEFMQEEPSFLLDNICGQAVGLC